MKKINNEEKEKSLRKRKTIREYFQVFVKNSWSCASQVEKLILTWLGFIWTIVSHVGY
jgi:hypothetical protein